MCPFAHPFTWPWGTSFSCALIISSWASSCECFMLTGLGFSCSGISSGAGSGQGLGFVRLNFWGSVDFLGNFFGWLPLVVFFSRYSKRPFISVCRLIKRIEVDWNYDWQQTGIQVLYYFSFAITNFYLFHYCLYLCENIKQWMHHSPIYMFLSLLETTLISTPVYLSNGTIHLRST